MSPVVWSDRRRELELRDVVSRGGCCGHRGCGSCTAERGGDAGHRTRTQDVAAADHVLLLVAHGRRPTSPLSCTTWPPTIVRTDLVCLSSSSGTVKKSPLRTTRSASFPSSIEPS